jgi:hypothetical protein
MKQLCFYTYMAIVTWADENSYDVEEYGNESRMGMHFITLQDEKDNVISFVFTGYSSLNGSTYMCVYSDLD